MERRSASYCCWPAWAVWSWYFGLAGKAGGRGRILAGTDPLLGLRPTPSQRATVKYFFVVAALWVVQVALGALGALRRRRPASTAYRSLASLRRDPHLAPADRHFWIATSWLATGLYVAPAVSGLEPKGQRLGVNVLFGALIFVVVGSLAGEWMGIQQSSATCGSGSALRATSTSTWAGLADPAVRRACLLAVAHVARPEAGAWRSGTRTIVCC